ncbi:unnamed protein product [Alternaria burnsii]|nr:unnamed protein product [Alternaria burnsii]
MMGQNKLPQRGDYISDDFVQQLFTTEKLRRQVQPGTSTEFSQESRDLVEFIKERARKIFAILVLIDQGDLISSLHKSHPMVDDHLLFDNADGDASRPYCTIEKLQSIPQLCAVAEKVYEKQWVFPTVLLSTVHLDFDPRFFKFPFRTPSTRISSGASGQVHRVVFEDGYLKDSNGESIKIEVVYKKIRQDNQLEGNMERIMREMKFLRGRQHPNISRLIASFTAGLERPTMPEDTTKCLYLLSPRAEMDMHTWLNHEPDYIKTNYSEQWNTQNFKTHIFDSMRGLISGLAYIHRHIGLYVGYHGDIKPKNILKFPEEGKLAWKICDFGTANLKTIDDTATRNSETTFYWAPEEFSLNTSEDGNHGRSHDVWSMGCIFLLLITVLEYRWSPDGLQAFEESRAQGSANTLDHAFCKSRPQIADWMAHLKNRRRDSTELLELLDLIEAMLRPRKARIFSWEVAVDLYTITYTTRTSKEIVDHLNEVIQKARDVDLELEHKPMSRARQDPRKDERYRKVLVANGWYDGRTTEEEKKVCAAERFVSTLPIPGTGDRIFGMEEVLKDISLRFEKTDFLALVGLRGVGKSLVALHHADHVSKQYQQESRPEKDVFWVRAHNIEDFEESYAAIAAKFTTNDSEFQSTEELWRFVKVRLEGKSTKKWLMVVDGFDHDRETQVIGPFLPRKNGQILFTTRNSLLVKDLVNWEKRRAYIEMQSPDSSAALKLFQTYVDDTLIGDSDKQAMRLLEEFNWPKMIRSISRHMNEKRLTCVDMYELLKKRKYKETERLLPNFAEQLLIPTLGASLHREHEWSDEIRLLLLLCQFDNGKGLDLKLIQVEYDEGDYWRVGVWLEKLLACCFIRKQNNNSKHSVYLVDTTVHLAVRTWMEKNETPNRKLERYNKVLSMLYRSYDSRKRNEQKKRKRKALRAPKPFASFKAILRPHFNSFVDYVGAAPGQTTFSLYDRAVQAVYVFSDVLLHERRFEIAIDVLEFTKTHFEPDDLSRPREDKREEENQERYEERLKVEDKTRRRRRSVYFQLSKLLAKAYLLRAKDERSLELQYFEKAEMLIKGLQSQVDKGDDTVVWAGRRLRAWDLELEMVRVFWESEQFDKAWTRFRNVSKIGVKVEDGQPVLPQPRGASCDWKDEQELRKLAIRVKREEYLLNLAHGKKHNFNGKKGKATSCWDAAYDACADLEIAVERWFPEDDTWNFEIEEDKANILVKLGSEKNLDDAEAILKKVLESCSLEGEHADEQRAWKAKYGLDHIRFQRKNPGDLGKASKSLEELVWDTGAALGINHAFTVRCVELLKEVYIATGNEPYALELEKEYGRSPRFEKRSQWTRWLNRRKREYWCYLPGGATLSIIVLILIWMLAR